MKRFETKGQYWLYAARIGAELLLRLARFEDARKMYDAIIEARTVPWARLGVARTELATGNVAAARRTLETLIGDMPGHADSYDVMGRVQMEQGEIAEALRTYRMAANLTPGCLLRLQRCGTLAFYAGQRSEALKMLESAMANGLRSKLFDMLSLVLIGFLRFDAKDSKGFKNTHDAMLHALERKPKETRLRRFEQVFRGLRHLLDRKPGDALELVRQFSTQALQEDDFDLEAASLLVGLWMRLAGQDLQLDEMMPVLTNIGLRYCTSKSSTEVLVAMTEGNERVAAELRGCHTRIFTIAETADPSGRVDPQRQADRHGQPGSQTPRRQDRRCRRAGRADQRFAESLCAADGQPDRPQPGDGRGRAARLNRRFMVS